MKFTSVVPFAGSRRAWIAVGVLGCALLLSACGSSDDSTSESTGGGGSTQAETGSSEGTSNALTSYLEYTGGKEGPADESAEPVTIGFMNQQGGQLTFPEGTSGAEAAVTYINENLGGINGHPLQLSTCFVATSEEEGQACAYKFINDEDLKLAVFGTVIAGSQSFAAANKGRKPTIMGNALSPADGTAKSNFIYNGSPGTLFGAMATFAKDELEASSVAIINPEGTPAQETLIEALEEEGIEYKTVSYPTNSPDMIAPLTAAGAQSSDMILAGNIATAQNCTVLGKSLKSLGLMETPVVLTAGDVCFSDPVEESLGGEVPYWVNVATQANLADESVEEVAAYREAASEAGMPEDDMLDLDGALSWSLVMTSARFLNEAGDVDATASTIGEAAGAFKGPLMLGAPEVECGILPKEPAVCGYLVQGVRYLGNGQYEQVGEWTAPRALG